MALAAVIELEREWPSKRANLTRVILISLAVLLAVTAAKFSGVPLGKQPRPLVDFDDFFIAAGLVWQGGIEKAYHFVTLSQVQLALSHRESFIPWTYPPQFDLVVAPLALFPLGAAYFIFTAGTLTAYLAALKQIAGARLSSVLLVFFPAMVITIACGQNGFLTGTLIALTCLWFQSGRTAAGLPLGLMAIKPHLAVAFAVYAVVNRRWGAVLTAAATVAVTSALATAVLGSGVWAAFVDGVRESRIFLELGFYPLFRMVSPYAAIRTFGFPAPAAFVAQAFVAVFAIAAVCAASIRFSTRQAFGLLQNSIQPDVPQSAIGDVMPLSVAGLTLAAMLALVWRILRRNLRSARQTV